MSALDAVLTINGNEAKMNKVNHRKRERLDYCPVEAAQERELIAAVQPRRGPT